MSESGKPAGPDPLAGKRKGLNDGTLNRLVWPDTGKGCPVQKGDVYSIRSGGIEITKTQRRQERHEGQKQMVWVAWFTRIRKSHKVNVLVLRQRAGGPEDGYTSDTRSAMKAQDDPEAGTINSTRPMDNPLNLEQPPEPEAIDSADVAQLPTTVAAQRRFAETRRHVERQRRLDQLARSVKNLQKRATAQGVDEDAIDEAIGALEEEMSRVERISLRAA